MTVTPTKYQQRDGLDRIWHAAIYSAAGLRSAWRSEAAFRQEVVLSAVVAPGVYWIGDTAIKQILLIGSLVLVLIVELLNSSVESTVDRIGSEYHPLSGQAKDMGSAAVLISLMFAAFVWGLLLLEFLKS